MRPRGGATTAQHLGERQLGSTRCAALGAPGEPRLLATSLASRAGDDQSATALTVDRAHDDWFATERRIP